MKTQYYTATSLDGFLATEDDSVDWLFPLGDPEDTSYPTFIADIGALVMGSATYEWILRNSEKVIEEVGSAWPYSQPTWVFTNRNLLTTPGADVRFVCGDVRTVHEEMTTAAAGKNIWIVGGGDLAGQFYDAGLLDELILGVGSVTLGRGKPLLPRRILSPSLQLTSARRIGTTMVELRYDVAHGPLGERRATIGE
ncbi:MAG: dihydrofolate reductase family protein [Candidatus Eisenbacteria bacterium]